MLVTRYQVQHILGINELDVDLTGLWLILVGGLNGQGKTSAITALRMALQGKSAMKDEFPDIPLKEGEREGRVEVHFDNGMWVEFTIERKRGGKVVETAELYDADGTPAPTTRQTIRDFLGAIGVDPLSFDRMSRAERLKSVGKLLGFDLSSLEAEEKEVFEERAAVNRDLKKTIAARDRLPRWADAPKEAVAVGTLLEKLGEARKHNDCADELHNDTVRAVIDAREAEARIEGARSAVAKATLDLQRAEEDLAKAVEVVAEIETREVGVEKIPVEPILKEIEGLDAINAKVRDNAAYHAAKEDADELQAMSDLLSDRLDKIRAEKKRTLEEAPWPVAHMSMNSDGIMLAGLPWEQASKSQRTIAACKLAMAANPELKLLVCQDGNDLDNETLEALEKVLKEEGYQMILEFVTRGDEDEARCSVVLEEGRVK
jgi:DNA repair exonuclease SbcCD ATPase subunit